ncbi:hypothetical protein imdm_1761 [gamma proteobacterium IMCC2047]|nr:hypothetical protein imdm_1761 [gamma proteobacterium IMCC2047]
MNSASKILTVIKTFIYFQTFLIARHINKHSINPSSRAIFFQLS